jgi:flagellar basal-body rod protein FlgF
MLFVSMDGARQTLLAQGNNSNNLANLSTTGFQADLVASEDIQVEGPGLKSRVHSQLSTVGFDPTPGRIVSTGRELDVAIVGPGWLAVQAFNGDEAYTRAGDLSVSAGGVLINGQGHPVLGDGGPISVPPSDAIEIARDGTVSVAPAGGSGSEVVTVGRIKLVSPTPFDMEKGPDGLMRMKDETQAQPDAAVLLQAGALERSNVNAVESLVNMIELSRLFETQVRMMKVADENAATTSAMLRLRG